MRIVSMVPSATEILCALGLAKDIVGISHDCDYPTEILNRPRLTGTMLGSDLTSYEIDQKVRASAASGRSLYVIQTEIFESLQPDLVITQGQCSVCAVDRDRTVCALESMKLDTKWLSLAATGFSGLYKDILDVGLATECRSQAEQLAAELAARLERIATQMVTLAGGDARLGSEREASSRVAVDQLRGESPEVIFLMPCSFSQGRSANEWTGICDLSPWRDFPAVREGRVFALESSLFHRPGPRLVDGVELMAALLHPGHCSFRAELDLWRKVA